MSASPANLKSLHGFSSLTLGAQVSAMTDVEPKLEAKSERTASPSADTAAISNRTVASRSTRQPRLSFSSFVPSSEHDYPKKLKSDATEENPPQREEFPVSAKEREEAEEEEVKRTWNLRPRKACGGLKKGNGVFPAEACGGSASEARNQKPSGVIEPKSNRQRGIPAESPGVELKNENHRLWVALSRDEIEEDVFSMSGNKPSRRPRKRTKTLQKHLDVIFPGLCLVGMNADCFRVPNSPTKRLYPICSSDDPPINMWTKDLVKKKRVDRYAGDMV